MSDWKDHLTDAERSEWNEFEEGVRTGLVPKMTGCAYVASCVPDADNVDVKFAVELGLAIMLGKPIIAIAQPGIPVPDGLRRAAHAVVVLDDSTEEAREKSYALLKEAVDALPDSL